MSGWRIVVVSSRAKLELKLNYLVIRKPDGINRVHIEEINTLIIESTAVSFTSSLMEALVRTKICIIFCDSKHLPFSQLMPLSGSHNASSKISIQIAWQDEIKAHVWANIVKEKITKQAECLLQYSEPAYRSLLSYAEEVADYDLTNREGHAAKVYFNTLFGHDFYRTAECKINSALDYGYSILLAAVAREIAANGYITQIGIFHHNVFNGYNLASDLMESFRPLVDFKVAHIEFENDLNLTREEKNILVNVLNETVYIDGHKTEVVNAVRIYVHSVLYALEKEDVSLIKNYMYEF